MNEIQKDAWNKFIPYIFGESVDEYGVPLIEVYKNELEDIFNQIVDIYKKNYFEDGLELGILVKYLFTECFDSCVATDREVYVRVGKEFPNLIDSMMLLKL